VEAAFVDLLDDVAVQVRADQVDGVTVVGHGYRDRRAHNPGA
jgi:hypothetical protein